MAFRKPLHTVQPDAIVARLNQIDASKVAKMPAPASTTLTDEEIDMIKDGVFIEGDFLNKTNMVLFPAKEYSGYYSGIFIATSEIGTYQITKSSKVIGLIPVSSHTFDLRSISQINGKPVPNYPSSDVYKQLVCDNGTLKWDDVLMEKIVDAKGHARFVEGDVDKASGMPAGLTISYGKWSLSGTHLLIVIAGSVENGTQIPNDTMVTLKDLPQFIFDKVVPVFGDYVESKQYILWGSDLTSQSSNLFLKKATQTLQIVVTNLTLTADRTFRAQFDLLIDNETPEPTE